jgi:DNA repair protein RadA/Sms
MFFCTECGGESAVWAGKCPHCGTWNTMTEETVGPGGKEGIRNGSSHSRPVPIGEVSLEEGDRLSTGFGEFDRVLGGAPSRVPSSSWGVNPASARAPFSSSRQ